MRETFESVTSGISAEMKGIEAKVVGEFAVDALERKHIMMLLSNLADALYLMDNIHETDETVETLQANYDRFESILHEKGFIITDYFTDLKSRTPLPVVADRLIQVRRERRS